MYQFITYFFTVLSLLHSQQNLEAHKTTIFLTGDIMLARSVMIQSLAKKDPTYPFIKVAEKLNSADIVFSNLETPIVEDCPHDSPEFKFCADPKMVEGLKYAGIDIVNLANNHTLNMGKEGLEETENILTQNGIKWVGQNNLEIIEKNGVKYGFLGFDYVSNKIKASDLDLISDSKRQVDVLIVATHWGVEYTNLPTYLQRDYAEKIVKAGADVIAGTHPHWVQPLELIDTKPVFYSLGNFVFDQMWSEDTKKGIVGKLEYDGKKLDSVQSLNIYLKHFAQPEWVN